MSAESGDFEPCIRMDGQRINTTDAHNNVVINGAGNVHIYDGGVTVIGSSETWSSYNYPASASSSSSSSSRTHRKPLSAHNNVVINGAGNVHIYDGGVTVIGSSETWSNYPASASSSSSSSSRTHRRPLSDSQHPPTKGDLDLICDNIGRRWKSLGRALGVSRGALEQVEIDFRSEGNYEMSWQMLLKWRRQHGDGARICDLARALDDIGLEHLARAIPVE